MMEIRFELNRQAWAALARGTSTATLDPELLTIRLQSRQPPIRRGGRHDMHTQFIRTLIVVTAAAALSACGGDGGGGGSGVASTQPPPPAPPPPPPPPTTTTAIIANATTSQTFAVKGATGLSIQDGSQLRIRYDASTHAYE